jgi:hypothetical protein
MRGLSLTFLILSVSFVASAAAAAVEEHVEYVSGIDTWRVEVFAGALNPGGLLEGPAREAGFRPPIQMCFLSSGQAFIATEGVIFTLTPDRVVRYFIGTPDLPGYQDGPAEQALLGRQFTVCSDGGGGLFVGDRSNRCLRRVTRRGQRWFIETVAGDPTKPPSELQLLRVREEGALPPTKKLDIIDGIGKQARFSYLHANVIADAQGNAYLMDSDFLRRVTPEGKVETLNPKGGTGAPTANQEPLESAHFRLIMGGGMTFGGDGNIYVADRWNHCIRKVDLQKKVVTVAVGPGRGYRDGPEKECGFHDSPGYVLYDRYRKRFYTNGVDDWGLRTWENGRMKTIAGGVRTNNALEGPARAAGTHWCGVLAVDPLPPHDIYFWSNSPNWRGRIGKLFRVSANANGGGR